MRFHFENHWHDISEIELLIKDDSYYEPLVQFILNWRKGNDQFYFQTSGSTGKPKSISVTRKQIEASVGLTRSVIDIQSTNNALLCLDPKYIASIMMAARCLVVDMNMIVVRASSNPLKLISDPVQIDFVSFVPFQVQTMLKDGYSRDLESINHILVGGAPIHKKLIDQISVLKNNIFQTYGMTETVSHIALMELSKGNYSGYYKVIDGVSISTNTKGCLMVRGPVTEGNLVETNDVVRILDESKFQWLGRSDNTINTGGVKVHPEELEDYIRHNTDLLADRSFFISSSPDDKLGSSITLFIEGQEIQESLLDQVQHIIQSRFTNHHKPRSIVYIPNFERTTSGKIRREATVLLNSKYQA